MPPAGPTTLLPRPGRRAPRCLPETRNDSDTGASTPSLRHGWRSEARCGFPASHPATAWPDSDCVPWDTAFPRAYSPTFAAGLPAAARTTSRSRTPPPPTQPPTAGPANRERRGPPASIRCAGPRERRAEGPVRGPAKVPPRTSSPAPPCARPPLRAAAAAATTTTSSTAAVTTTTTAAAAAAAAAAVSAAVSRPTST